MCIFKIVNCNKGIFNSPDLFLRFVPAAYLDSEFSVNYKITISESTDNKIRK